MTRYPQTGDFITNVSARRGEVGGQVLWPSQVELRSRPIEAGSTGIPRERGARLQGRPSFGYFSWPRKKNNQPPGCPRQN